MKKRLDVLLVERGIITSREKAKAAIMSGEVTVDGVVFDKPGMSVSCDAEISHKGDKCPYVSRGGLKLEKAIDVFEIDLNSAVCMDIGASTGGFTDCMLKNGARKVYAIDVGYGQLDYSLRTDERVVNIERCNFRLFENNPENPIIMDEIDFASIDVSFISLKHIFPKCAEFLKDGGKVCALIKPQFEAGREQVGKNGIVKDPAVHSVVIQNVIGYAEESGLSFEKLDFSPIKGGKGNIEYLILLNKGGEIGYNETSGTIEKVVSEAHKRLDVFYSMEDK
ncbi:MAG: TlyA family RNA methyltransferase [Firmicutes bacterium]|nr:TlyA family RNA methyltransferase [Bacillota bacterium]